MTHFCIASSSFKIRGPIILITSSTLLAGPGLLMRNRTRFFTSGE